MHDAELSIGGIQPQEVNAVVDITETVVRSGKSYAIEPDLARKQIQDCWFTAEHGVRVAARGDEVVGSSFLKLNQPRPGAHVANCGCATAADSTGLGVGRAMCLESMKIDRIRGFRAIQFDLVLTPNPRAVRLWRDLGFQKIGRVPMAHR
ncbi:MAG: GNAT family N-acetyltransferase [Micrococcales bacterium]|nr:GNAT family N-acetyltransferase [Micrococcales bacterium]